jgi:hypothetical protein
MKPGWTARQVLVVRIVRALAFVGLVLVVALVAHRPAQQSRPRVEHTVSRPERVPDETAVFEPQQLIFRQEDLHLSARQVQELRKLDASYRRVTTALIQKQDAARKDVTRFLDEARKHKAVASSQLQEKMAELERVHEDLADVQRRFREAAKGLLSEKQRAAGKTSR